MVITCSIRVRCTFHNHGETSDRWVPVKAIAPPLFPVLLVDRARKDCLLYGLRI